MSESDPRLVVEAFYPRPAADFVAAVADKAFLSANWLYDTTATHDLWQGDVLPRLRLAWIGAGGEAQGYTGRAILHSHGCDTLPGRDMVATFSPCFELAQYLRMLVE